ncbi:MAG: geranylgeranyl reductase family protein [Chitinivibrionales bacterium]|nr:geranylgeranyl reductase family protein [Chitinivibrionales bacterium]
MLPRSRTVRYDAVIVGASISGLFAGMQLAREGWRVCIVDRKKHIGLPVRCGEATGNRAELSRFFDVDESWIAGDFAGFVAHVNNGFTLQRELTDAGVLLHRDKFEQWLAQKARHFGAEIRLESAVTGLIRARRGWSGIRSRDGATIDAAYIIGADGCESMVGQWAGLTTHLALRDSFSAVQYQVESDFCRDGLLHFFVGASIIPHGYLWIFPKGMHHIAVGAGIYGPRRHLHTARHYLDTFIHAQLGDVGKDNLICGCAPLAICPKSLVRDNVMIIGDAARQVNPLTAGGIMNALESTALAVTSLLKSKRNANNATLVRGYCSKWKKTQRRQQKIFAILLRVFLESTDQEVIAALKAGSEIFKEPVDRKKNFTLPLVKVLKLTVVFFPKLMRHWRLLTR